MKKYILMDYVFKLLTFISVIVFTMFILLPIVNKQHPEDSVSSVLLEKTDKFKVGDVVRINGLSRDLTVVGKCSTDLIFNVRPYEYVCIYFDILGQTRYCTLPEDVMILKEE